MLWVLLGIAVFAIGTLIFAGLAKVERKKEDAESDRRAVQIAKDIEKKKFD